MAELFVPKIVDQLSDVVLKQFVEKVNLVMGVEEEVEDISSKLVTIEKVLHDAERRRLKERSVGIWLEKLEDITYEIDDVLDEWNYKIHKAKDHKENTDHQNARILQQGTLWSKVCSFIPSLCSCLKQVPFHSDIAMRIKGINEKLELTLKEADQFKFVISSEFPYSQDSRRIMTTSIIDETEVYGLASDKNALIHEILSKSITPKGKDGIQVISLVGVGGSGKTKLAQLIYNDYRVNNHFELKKWVCVSDPFDEKRIAKAILESPDNSSLESLQLESLLQLIKETFSSKRFLLVLDDVWTEEDSKWKPFKDSLKNGAPRSVVMITTRSLRVAKVMGTIHTHHMTLMSDSDCWQIMQKIAFAGRSQEWCKKVERIGLKIAEKCKGLPLAAKTMGSLLRFKDTVQQWLDVLESEIWQLEEAAVNLFPHLYLSYNELSAELKHCFSYCAIFPKDHVIDVEDLIRLWIAQGYVRPNRRGERLELIGLEYFNNLAMRSFFQEFEKFGKFIDIHEYMRCKMHDIVHDFAQFLTRNECHVLEKIHYAQGTGTNSSSERARHLTWLNTEEAFSSSVAIDFRKLRSLFASEHRRVVPLDLFCCLKCVRTLTLSDCGFREVPSVIGSLIHLRYLDLSDNPFEELPEAICILYYLETFKIRRCKHLLRLPERIEGLVHLRHLLNSSTYHLCYMPQGLGKLASLCSLDRFIIANRDHCNDLAILKYLNQLETLHIQINTDGEVDFESADLGKKIYMREMHISFGEEAARLKELPPNLQRLLIEAFQGTHLPSCLVTESLANTLTKLSIYEALNLSSLPALWKLSSLEELELCELPNLKSLVKGFFGIREALCDENGHDDTLDMLSNSRLLSLTDEAVAFPNLRRLYFYYLPNWTNWEDLSEDDEKVDASIMPRLESLNIYRCPNLEALPHRILKKISSLKNLDVDGCEKLVQRYSDKTGNDWMMISHIPRVSARN